jgi:hypothetical protein
VSTASRPIVWPGPRYRQSAGRRCAAWRDGKRTSRTAALLAPGRETVPWRRLRRTRAGRGAAGAVLAALGLLPACMAAAPVPSRAAASQLQATTAGPAPAAQVIAAYTAYAAALEEAEPQPQPRAAAILAQYAAQPYLGRVLAQIAAYRAGGAVAWGYLVPHVISVQVSRDGTLAVLQDCQDASSAWLVSSATGRVIAGSTGSSHTLLAAILARTGGRWRVKLLAHLAGRCSRMPSPP